MAAPVGSIVSIVYDAGSDIAIGEGDFLCTNAGRCYRVLAARRVKSAKQPHRWRLSLLVIERLPLDDPGIDPEAKVHALVFYPRG